MVLKWIFNMLETTDKLARWGRCLPKFEFDTVHKAGMEKQASDSLLWLKVDVLDRTDLGSYLPGTMFV